MCHCEYVRPLFANEQNSGFSLHKKCQVCFCNSTQLKETCAKKQIIVPVYIYFHQRTTEIACLDRIFRYLPIIELGYIRGQGSMSSFPYPSKHYCNRVLSLPEFFSEKITYQHSLTLITAENPYPAHMGTSICLFLFLC